MTVDPDILKAAVLSAIEGNPLAKAVQDVQVEPAIDEDNDSFLRVELQVRLPDRDVDAELEALLEKIEEAIAAVDERYASVRFLDAA